MEAVKSDIGMRIHLALKEVAFTKEQIAQVDLLKRAEQDRLENGQLSNREYEINQTRFDKQSRHLFLQLENKTREIEQLKTRIKNGK